MKKRMLVLLCILSLLAGMYVLPAKAAETGTKAAAASDRFAVGFAKGDMNPWVYSDNLKMGVDLSGITEDYSEYVSQVSVYNPDTKKTTTEQIIKIPLAGYATSSTRLAEFVRDDNGDGVVGLGDGVFFTCTTVTDANGYTLFMFTTDTVSGYSKFQTDLATNLKKKLGISVTTDQVTVSGSHSHAGPDLNVLRNAKITGDAKSQLWKTYYNYVLNKAVDAAVDAYNNRQFATMSRGVVDGSEATGYQLNQIRQYLTTQHKKTTGKATGVEFISGSHLNTYTSKASGVAGYTYTKTPIAVADDKMYILQFTFDDPALKPIIQVNWRAHATMLGTVDDGGEDDDSSNKGISSDYINSFRKAMEDKGYNMAFIQGAGGNIISGSDWVPAGMTDQTAKAIYYGGTMLAEAATACLENHMQVQTGNIIRASHVEMQTASQTYPEGLVAAANDYINNGHSGYHPKPYLHTDGKYYYINSSFHANAVAKGGNPPTLSLNSFLLGDGVAIVTSPNEMYDRYSLDVDTLAEAQAANRDNDWNDLITGSYGMPFVFGYTNGHSGYLGDYLSYSYNEDFVYTRTDGTIDGTYGVGLGSYETNASRYARGTGEAVIATYVKMLTGRIAVCEHCGGEEKEWTRLTAINADSTTLESGHYYLFEDITTTGIKSIDGNVCLDLNGHTFTSTGRTFFCKNTSGAGTVFSLMDSSANKTGKVIAGIGDNKPGGVLRTDTKAGITFNLYGGTLQLDNSTATEYTVEKGGIVCLYGTMNMYGGIIRGAKMAEVKSNNVHPAYGAAIYVYDGSNLNVSGGRILSGTVPATSIKVNKTTKEETTVYPKGKCVFLGGSANITLSGNAIVNEIYINAITGNSVTVGKAPAADSSGKVFTGVATLNPEALSVSPDSIDIGTLAYGTVPVTLSCVDQNHRLSVKDGNLLVREGTSIARIGQTCYADVASAVQAYTGENGSFIQLLTDVDTLNVSGKTIYLDLNGCDVKNVTGTGTLYCFDSETDDYLVDAANNTGYGKLKAVATGVRVYSVSVGTIPTTDLETYPAGVLDGYLMVSQNGYGISFHRVNLQMTHVTLRAGKDAQTGECNPGMYYKSAFGADAVAADRIESFGVALSRKDVPTAENLETDCAYSRWDAASFIPGQLNTDKTSILHGVMKQTNTDATNRTNAQTQVYARAYAVIDGQYWFGEPVSRSLETSMAGNQTETISYNGLDAIWELLDDAQHSTVLEMYRIYQSVMQGWNLPNIKAAFASLES